MNDRNEARLRISLVLNKFWAETDLRFGQIVEYVSNFLPADSDTYYTNDEELAEAFAKALAWATGKEVDKQ